MKKDKIAKKPVTLRFNPNILDRVDEAVTVTSFKSRTDIIEEASLRFVDCLLEVFAHDKTENQTT